MRRLVIIGLATVLSACANQAVPNGWPGGWTATRTPPGHFNTGNPEIGYETQNSLPGRAATNP